MTAPEFTIPVSVQEVDESLAGWPYGWKDITIRVFAEALDRHIPGSFDLERAVADANADYFEANPLPVPYGPERPIPKWLLKPTSGPCIHCHKDSDEQIRGEWFHTECNEALIAEQQADYRADSPTHVPYRNLGRR